MVRLDDQVQKRFAHVVIDSFATQSRADYAMMIINCVYNRVMGALIKARGDATLKRPRQLLTKFLRPGIGSRLKEKKYISSFSRGERANHLLGVKRNPSRRAIR